MTKVNTNKLPKLETRMLNILRSYPIPEEDVKGMYKAALNRLVEKGIAIKSRKSGEYKLSMSAAYSYATSK